MNLNLSQTIANSTPRQKMMAGIFLVVVLVILWMVIDMFRGSSATPPTTMSANTSNMSMSPGSPKPGMPMQPNMPNMAMQPRPPVPQPAQLLKSSSEMSERERELTRLQEETQEKYLATLNELQMLKLSLQIAETNSAIMKAKLATITTQKNIVDLLTVQAPVVTQANYAKGLENPVSSGTTTTTTQVQVQGQREASYTVISVTQLQYKWAAVVGFQGNLYNVSIGDVLPPDGSVVISINKSGIELDTNGVKRKVSLVPII